MNITYNINNPRALNLGQQYDHNVRTVTFTGFVPVNETDNTIYLKFEGLGLYPLLNMSFQVSQSFTLKEGTFLGQLLEISNDETLVQNSNTFKMMVKPSLAEDTEIVNSDPSIDLWFNEMSELYQTMKRSFDEGLFVTHETVIDAIGYVPAKEEDIPVVPTNVSAFENDAEYISAITSEDVTEALGFTPADQKDIPVIPTDVSAFTNDANYISGITDGDVKNALGYTPADVEDIPYVPSNVSEFKNDAGYLSNLRAQDIFNILQYVPEAHSEYILLNDLQLSSAVNSIVLSSSNNEDPYDLSSVFVALINDKGIGGGANSYMFAFDGDGNVIGGTQVFFYAPANAVKSAVEVSVEGSVVKMNSTGWTAAAVYSPVVKTLMMPQLSEAEDDSENEPITIHRIEINSNGGSFATGTRVIVLGKSKGAIGGNVEYVIGDDVEFGDPTLPVVGIGQADLAVLTE